MLSVTPDRIKRNVTTKNIAKTIMKELKEIFNRHQKDGTVSIDYDTEIFIGKIH